VQKGSNRVVREVPEALWQVTPALGDRQSRLLSPPNPISLVAALAAEAAAAADIGAIRCDWKSSCEFPGYFRAVAVVPLSVETFDCLFNGRSGYRAQYYLSPEEGVPFNRDILAAFSHADLNIPWSLARTSFAGPHSKIWVFDEVPAFNSAQADTLNPPRWVSNRATRGRKAPLPPDCALDVKGAFIHPTTLDLQVDELKVDRACDLFRKGYT
jgi:hypothetical protein